MEDRISDPRRARRMARVLFSDICVYTGDRVRIGLEKDDLFERLEDEIERARVFYHQHVDPTLADGERIFNWALVDVLIYGNRRVASHIW